MKDTLEDFEKFVIDVIIHNRRGIRANVCRGIFWCLSKVYSRVVESRLYFYRERFIHDHHLGVPVISIGNLTVGGTGKTPVVELFAKALRDRGRRVAVLSRGYKSKRVVRPPWWKRLAKTIGLANYPSTPPRVVSDGRSTTPLLDSHIAGDEPWMLASNLSGVSVVVDRNRVKAGRYAIKELGADVLLLDDGLQYLKLKHRHDIVLVDRTAPFGTGYLLPRGTLREHPRNLRRASYIFITKSDGESEKLIKRIRRYNKVAEIIECRHRPLHLVNIVTREVIPLSAIEDKYVGAISGIAIPESFESGLRKLGAKVEVTARFADHHRFEEAEVRQFVERCVRRDLHYIVTTEKDFVRFPKLPAYDIPICFLRVEIEITRGREIFDKIMRVMCEPRPVPPGALMHEPLRAV
jgi:tetraacyldisaccharide 4'-kinase